MIRWGDTDRLHALDARNKEFNASKAFQRGSLKIRIRNGKKYWYAQWRENGQPKSKELGFCSSMSQGKAEAELAQILEPINKLAGQRQDETYTFGHFIEAVYLPICRGKWKASTRMTEENRIQAHLVPAFDPRLMDEISRDELQSFLNRKAKQLSQSGLDHLRFRLRSIFTLAESEGVVDRNPARSLYTPKRCKPDRPRHVLTPAQLAEMAKALNLRERVIARLATWEGMRPGEILALQVGDCGSDAIFVRRRVYKGDLDLPKTKRSIRQVALSTGTVALLNEWMSHLKNRSAEAWLFPAENETSPLRRDNVWRRNMHPKLKDAGLQWATFLVMRRTFASLSKSIGIDAHTRSAQMGNTVDVNENEYAVTSFDEKLAAVRKLESSVVIN